MDAVPYDLITAYQRVAIPISDPVTKFGGQPVWIQDPEWPLSRSTGAPMRFVGQVFLDPSIFGEIRGKMAYIFITDPEDGEYVDNTWEAESGENAVIVQPGRQYVATTAQARGPALACYLGERPRTLGPGEFAVSLVRGTEAAYDVARPGFADEDQGYEEQFVLGDKIGGSPHFVQAPQFPEGEGWRLLAQVGRIPCKLPFGGYAYVFLSADGASAKMVWQV